jgi:hypothetical protein
MLSGLRRFLMSPAIGPISMAVAVALAVALAAYASLWRSERAEYEARIVELSRAAERTQSGLRAELTACHQADLAREAMEAEFAKRGPTPDRARANALLAAQPEGIDACARMESADRAVLSNLKR